MLILFVITSLTGCTCICSLGSLDIGSALLTPLPDYPGDGGPNAGFPCGSFGGTAVSFHRTVLVGFGL